MKKTFLATTTLFAALVMASVSHAGYNDVLQTMASNDTFAGSGNNGAWNQTGSESAGFIVERVDTDPTYAAVALKAGTRTGNVGVSEDEIANGDLVDAERRAAARVGYRGVKVLVESDGANSAEVTATGDSTLVGAASGIKEDVAIVVIDTRHGPSADVSAQMVSGNVAGGTASGQDLSTIEVQQESSLKLDVDIRRTRGDLTN